MLRCVVLLFSVLSASIVLAQPISESLLDEENALIVEMEFERSVYSDYIELYQYEAGYLVPLSSIFRFLDFPITIDTQTNQIKGWFINETNTVFIDIAREVLVLKGEVQPYPKTLIVYNKNYVYMDSALFERLFNIELKLNYSVLTLTIIPKVKLPIQLQYERQKKQELFKKSFENEQTYETIRSEYKLLSYPKIDATIGYEYNEAAKRNNNMDYSFVSRGDLGYLTHNLTASGVTNDSLNSLRFSVGRSDIERKTLGLSELYVGDVSEVANFLSSRQGQARGIRLSTFDASTPTQFDTTNFEGDSQPGWDIELYRNGTLIDFLTVGDDGRYEFNDVELFYGNNNFKILSYGPQGQIRETNRTVRIDSNFIKQGDFRYRMSLTDRSKTLFGVDEDDATISHKDGVKFSTNARYGVTQNINLEASHTHLPLADGKTHDFHGIGLYASVKEALIQLNSMYDSRNGGHAHHIGANTSIGSLNSRLSHTAFSNYFSETESEESTNLKTSQTNLDFDTQVTLHKQLPRLSIGAGGSYETFKDDTSLTRLSNRFSTNIASFGITNNVNWTALKQDNDTTENADGTFSIRQRLLKTLVRISTNYDLLDSKDLTDIDGSIQYSIDKKSNLRANVSHDLQGSNNTTYLLTLNRNLGFATLSTFGEYSDNDDFRVGTNLTFSLSKHPTKQRPIISSYNASNSGDLLVQSFLDENNNGLHDDNEQALENVKYTVRGGRLKDIKDPLQSYVTNVTSLSASQIEVDGSSFEDPYYAPVNSGYRIIAHPASFTQVKFPVVRVSEVEGTIYIADANSVRGAPSVRIQLLDINGDIAYQTRSEFDGFFLFDQVKVGTYRLKVDKRDTDSVNAKEVLSDAIFVDGSEDIIQLDDITIARNSFVSNGLGMLKEVIQTDSAPLPSDADDSLLNEVKSAAVEKLSLEPNELKPIHNLPVAKIQLPTNNAILRSKERAQPAVTKSIAAQRGVNIPQARVIAPTHKTLPQKRYTNRGY